MKLWCKFIRNYGLFWNVYKILVCQIFIEINEKEILYIDFVGDIVNCYYLVNL